MLELKNVTLAAISSINLQQTRKALEYSCRGIRFGEVVLLSHKKPWGMPGWIRFDPIAPMTDILAYNRVILYELWKHIRTDYVLINHYDGFVVHPELWDSAYLEYDYIGAPWPSENCPEERIDDQGRVCRVGNGVSLRSRRLLESMDREKIPFEPWKGTYSEDVLLCIKHRNRLEAQGLKFAPVELAAKFSHENDITEWDGTKDTFMFHEWSGTNRRYPRFLLARLIDKTIKI